MSDKEEARENGQCGVLGVHSGLKILRASIESIDTGGGAGDALKE